MRTFEGNLKGFPEQVVERMLRHQVDQGNPKDLSVFVINPTEGIDKRIKTGAGKGFCWNNTREGFYFWNEVINEKNFDLFFKEYPHELEFKKDTVYKADNLQEANQLFNEAHRQGYKWSSGRSFEDHRPWGNLNCYYIARGTYDTEQFYDEQNFTIVKVSDFFKKKKYKNSRFPFTLSRNNARKIVRAACDPWVEKLKQKWSSDLFLHDSVEVSESFYKEMRAACTLDQHKLLDEIFGKDVDFSILNNEDVFYVETSGEFKWLFKGELFKTSNHIDLSETHSIVGRLVSTEDHVTFLRKATTEEKEIYYKCFPEWSIKNAKDGEPVWVKLKGDCNWLLRYANGKGYVYAGQKKHGRVVDCVGKIMKFDSENLPFND